MCKLHSRLMIPGSFKSRFKFNVSTVIRTKTQCQSSQKKLSSQVIKFFAENIFVYRILRENIITEQTAVCHTGYLPTWTDYSPKDNHCMVQGPHLEASSSVLSACFCSLGRSHIDFWLVSSQKKRLNMDVSTRK